MAILLDSTLGLPELYNNLGNALRGAGQIDESHKKNTIHTRGVSAALKVFNRCLTCVHMTI